MSTADLEPEQGREAAVGIMNVSSGCAVLIRGETKGVCLMAVRTDVNITTDFNSSGS